VLFNNIYERGFSPLNNFIYIEEKKDTIMKIDGKKLKGPYVKTLVFPRDSGNLVFKFKAVMNDEEFLKLCPMPEPPVKMYPGGSKVPDVKDPEYLKLMDEWGIQKVYWQFLNSISATKNLKWETVDLKKPETWGNYMKELEAAFPEPEQFLLMEAFTEVQGLDQQKIDQATKDFLADHLEGPKK
jgi:hypothetical protein